MKRLDKSMSDAKKQRFYVGLQEKTLPENEKDRWFPCYWYPLIEVKDDIPVLAFYSDFFND